MSIHMMSCFRFTLTLALMTAFHLPAVAADDVKIRPDVVYGHKDGLALTFDVLTPAEPNGAGVLSLQSGGWYSRWNDPKSLIPISKPLLDRGFTVFIVRHGSAPKYAVPDAVADVRRCVRFIRMTAEDLGVDPERLGVLGGSAGGHLTLMLATGADEGDEAAQDEVLRHSSRIAAGVALFPPTDLRGWVENPPAEIAKHPTLEPPLTFDPALEAGVSPLLQVTPDDAPVLLIHGDKDVLVTIDHSQKMIEALEKAEVPSKLVVIEGAGHGFTPQQNKDRVLPALVEWYQKHLATDAEK